MSKQDKSSEKAGAGDEPKRKNPGLEVVNIYGSGPLPVGPRTAPEPQAEDAAREEQEQNLGALSTSQQGGGGQPSSPPETKK